MTLLSLVRDRQCKLTECVCACVWVHYMHGGMCVGLQKADVAGGCVSLHQGQSMFHAEILFVCQYSGVGADCAMTSPFCRGLLSSPWLHHPHISCVAHANPLSVRLQPHPACPTPLEKKREKKNTRHVMASRNLLSLLQLSAATEFSLVNKSILIASSMH